MEKKTTMMAYASPTIRGLVKWSNEKNISKEDIVTIQQENNQYVIIYYI